LENSASSLPQRGGLGWGSQQSKVADCREIGSAPLKQGGSVHLFIATIMDGNGVETEVPYTVTVAGDGFVDKVE